MFGLRKLWLAVDALREACHFLAESLMEAGKAIRDRSGAVAGSLPGPESLNGHPDSTSEQPALPGSPGSGRRERGRKKKEA